MADRSEHLGIIVTAQDLASGKLGKVRTELSLMGPAGRVAAVGLGTAMKLAQTSEKAFGHLKDRLLSLAGPLGFVGLGVAAGGISAALERGITRASDMGFAVEKLTGLTGENATAMSTLLVMFERFGIDATKTAQIVGFTEKTLGKLTIESGAAGKSSNQLALAQETVRKASETLHVAQLKLIETENKKKVSASALAAAHNHVTDATLALAAAHNRLQTAQMASNDPTSKAEALQKRYGIQLLDSSGKALAFGTILAHVADYYNSGAAASDKALVAATLFGRGYAQMIPILKLGSQGIADAEQAARDLGLVLTAQNATDLKEYRNAIRESGEAIGGLELQIGLVAIPAIKDLANSITEFLAHGGRDQLVSVFKDGLANAQRFAGFITGDVIPAISGLASNAKGFWDSIPAPLRDFLFHGIIADRTINFLFGISPIHVVTDVVVGGLEKGLGGLLAGFGSRGATPANPMFVEQVGLGAGGLGAAGGGGVKGLLKATIVGAVIVEGFNLWAQSLTDAVDKNNALRDQGMSPQQIADYKYSQMTPADQQAAIKHGYGPNGIARNSLSTQTSSDLTESATQLRNAARMTDDTATNNAEAASQLRNAAHSLSAGAASVRDYTHALYARAAALLHTKLGPGGHTIAPSINAIGALTRFHKAADVVLDADQLTAKFLDKASVGPWFSVLKNQERALKGIEAAQRQALAHGDVATAHKLGLDIAKLKGDLKRVQEDAAKKLASSVGGVARAVAAQKMSVQVGTAIYLSTRGIGTNLVVDSIRSMVGGGVAGGGRDAAA